MKILMSIYNAFENWIIHRIQIETFSWHLSHFIICKVYHICLNKTALICAAHNGKEEIVRLLLARKNIDINITDIIMQKKLI